MPTSLTRLSDAALLKLRLRDLPVRLAGSALEPLVQQLHEELRSRAIHFLPHVWVSDAFFTADHVPGIAVPFYLLHPRLRELEQSQMLDVEGGTHDWAMRILRHEAGHALDNAFQLHRRRHYRELFGNYSDPYPDSYKPRPYTRRFVVHLDMWYAQAHPAEDFAETFAVWLRPNSNWRQQYADWPAIKKLQYVDELMTEIRKEKPILRTRKYYKPLRSLSLTLREHYQQKREYYCRSHPRFYHRDLRRLFSADKKFARRSHAAPFLEQVRAEVRMMISRWTGESQYTIDQTLADMIDTVRRHRMRLTKSREQTKVDVMMMLAVQTMNYLNDGRHRVML